MEKKMKIVDIFSDEIIDLSEIFDCDFDDSEEFEADFSEEDPLHFSQEEIEYLKSLE